MEPHREASTPPDTDIVAAFERAADGLGRVRAALRGAIFGQDRALELALAAAVAGGWVMLVGPPGSAKTAVSRALAGALGLQVGRMVFTPDVRFDDVIGDQAMPRWADASGAGRMQSGPLFQPLFLAEDLDRAQPKVRAAVLEASHEGVVRQPGGDYPLARPFQLMATSTQEGVASFDETEADRFLVRIDMGPPDRTGEKRLLLATAAGQPLRIAPQIGPAELVQAQRIAVELPVGEQVVERILDLVRRARPEDPTAPAIVRSAVARGPGPRAGQALMRLARARALIDGRPSPSAADVEALAPAVLRPRLVMTRGSAGREAEVIEALLAPG